MPFSFKLLLQEQKHFSDPDYENELHLAILETDTQILEGRQN